MAFQEFFSIFSSYSRIEINFSSADQNHLQNLLAKKVLAEVPDQITGYMKSKGIVPLQIINNSCPLFNPPSLNNNKKQIFSSSRNLSSPNIKQISSPLDFQMNKLLHLNSPSAQPYSVQKLLKQ